mmetsp:Transcript_57119/g.94908  ORF Transcript_57119/g.94908 Transcript_57119/m.94908 type:complete len:273 (+) Transcript_57119:72-890(+)|eukprot:CAMPEP_0202688544 /NCGR_PEP_ID=MMETSP1385-20130828/4039_1 /ASSEMBLY_ACC=CAM_ASM_000861 /TAXON_ID=933848 /ORGANISM="Elphidium margaritaceum" /LENGTH=272 /DNA_ID=CAMNT_0049343539 /DNA_START=46 /DNA_END=864 /DNA_ORIENTATION=+
MSACTSLLCAALCVAASAAAISKPTAPGLSGFTSLSGFTNKAAAQAWVDTEFVPNEKTVWGDNADFNSVYSDIVVETDPPTWMIDDAQMSYADVKARAAAIQQKITNYELSCVVDTLESAFPSLEIATTCDTTMDFNVAILGPNPVVAKSKGKFEFNARGNLVRRELKSDPAGSNTIRAILDCVLSITAMCKDAVGGGDAVGGDYVFKFGDVKIDTFDAILLGILSLITVLLMLVLYGVFATVRKVAQIYDGSTSKTCEYSAVPKSDEEISS